MANLKYINRLVEEIKSARKQLADVEEVISNACSVMIDAEALIDALADEVADLSGPVFEETEE